MTANDVDRADCGERGRKRRPERPRDELVDRVRHDRPLRLADGIALGRLGVSPVAVSVRVTGLAGATYHFRLVAANDIGTTAGADQDAHRRGAGRLDRLGRRDLRLVGA